MTTGEVDPATLLHAYRCGLFPMAESRSGRLHWYRPTRRGLLPLDDRFHVPQRLHRTIRQGRFELRFDTAYADVMAACRENRPETWLSDGLMVSYQRLFALGHAHSVETWRNGRLVGGVYGVHLGRAFFGESMFHRETDASKVALVGLVMRLRARGFALLDTQWLTPHLQQFGGYECPVTEYESALREAVDAPASF